MMALQFPMPSHPARQFSKLDAHFFPSMLGPGEAPWTTGPQYEQRTPQLDGGDNGGDGGNGGEDGGGAGGAIDATHSMSSRNRAWELPPAVSMRYESVRVSPASAVRTPNQSMKSPVTETVSHSCGEQPLSLVVTQPVGSYSMIEPSTARVREKRTAPLLLPWPWSFQRNESATWPTPADMTANVQWSVNAVPWGGLFVSEETQEKSGHRETGAAGGGGDGDGRSIFFK